MKPFRRFPKTHRDILRSLAGTVTRKKWHCLLRSKENNKTLEGNGLIISADNRFIFPPGHEQIIEIYHLPSFCYLNLRARDANAWHIINIIFIIIIINNSWATSRLFNTINR